MSILFRRFIPLLLAGALNSAVLSAAPLPDTLLYSLFDPSTNAQSTARQGSSVAVDGNLVVVGVPGDEVGAHDAGTVKVYDATTGMLLHTLVNPHPSAGEFFGWAVGISGTWVVVGANSDKGGSNLVGDAVGSAFIYDLAGPTPTLPMITLTNPSPSSGDLFGHAVAISGNRVVIGSPGEDTDATDAGVVYVYDLSGAAPAVPQFVLRNPSPATNEGFGFTVAISGGLVVAATPFDGTGAPFAGSAYVFDLAGAAPTAPVYTLSNPNPAASDQFGYAVAISGTQVVVGANQDDTVGTDAGSAYVYDLGSASPSTPVLTLPNPAPGTGDNFGYSVAISGALVVVGVVYDDQGATDAGGVFVYDLASGTPGVPALVLNNPVPEMGDYFGSAVAISGTRVVVGTPNDDLGAANTGAAYLFDLSSSTPTEPRFVMAVPSPAFGDYFGRAVAISGTRVVVGADGDDTGATEAGRVYVYDLASPTPKVPIATLNNPSPAELDLFGWTVGIDGPRVVVGAYGDDAGGNNAGSAYVYDLSSATPTLPMLVLTNPTPAASDSFGAAVAISGTRVVIGALFDDTGANNAGSAYVFDVTSVQPTVPVATLTNPTPALNDRFGSAVAISGTRVVIGAYQDDSVSPDSGSAYVYDLSSPTPGVPVVTLNNPGSAFNDGDLFGYSVAISGVRVVVGAYRDSVDRGSAYVFDLSTARPTVPVAVLNNPSSGSFDYFGWAVAISGTLVLVGAPHADFGAGDSGTTYVYDLTGATPTVPVVTLNNPSPALADYFGWAVAVDGGIVVSSAYYDDTNAEDRGAVYIFGAKPALSIRPASLDRVTISWTPVAAAKFVLQKADSLAPANWSNAPSGAANPVTLPTADASRFYHLVQP